VFEGFIYISKAYPARLTVHRKSNVNEAGDQKLQKMGNHDAIATGRNPVGQAPSAAVAARVKVRRGYRIIACKIGDQVRLWRRNGRKWSGQFLAVTEALD
jgi:hypothetical protein